MRIGDIDNNECILTDAELTFFRESMQAWRTPCPYIECDGIPCEECPFKELTDKMLEVKELARKIIARQEEIR